MLVRPLTAAAHRTRPMTADRKGLQVAALSTHDIQDETTARCTGDVPFSSAAIAA